ncbi:MAG TPA: hypothetical protein VKX31_00410 [Brumimicrobium sp.]|nr:hypothetical protein [Brumimicrobium sp.]
MKLPSKKVIIGAVVGILLTLAVRAVILNKRNKSEAPQKNADDSTDKKPTGIKNGIPTECDKNTVLKRGKSCQAVLYSQKQINMVFDKLGISKLEEDGIFGSKTEAAFLKLLGKKTGAYTEVVEARKSIQ